MSFNMRDYVSDDHIESIGEIAKSQSAIIQALSLENSILQNQLQQKENIIKEVREYIEEHTEDVELNIYGMPPVIRSFRGNTQTLLEILDKVGDIK